MKLTGKQRAFLRAQANALDTILQVGKSGVNDNLVKQLDDALTARELVKSQVLETSPLSAREAAQSLSTLTNSQSVQVIGRRFILYRRNEKDPLIQLP